MTAAEASRRFADLLGAAKAGETVVITRGGRPVAEISPASQRTGADLRAALADVPPPDERFAEDVADALTAVAGEGNDPRADG